MYGVTTMEILQAISWPHVAFIFAVVFILLFRSSITGLIRRITKIDKQGLVAEPSPETQREKERKEDSKQAVQELLDVVGNSILLSEQEANIRNDLESKNLSTEGDSVKVLVKHLAATQILLTFEKVHGMIFGSQILLLKRLNEVIGQGRPMSFLNAHLQSVKHSHPELFEGWTLDKYLEFLFAHMLIVQHGSQFHITNFGVEYLTWTVRAGRADAKAL